MTKEDKNTLYAQILVNQCVLMAMLKEMHEYKGKGYEVIDKCKESSDKLVEVLLNDTEVGQ